MIKKIKKVREIPTNPNFGYKQNNRLIVAKKFKERMITIYEPISPPPNDEDTYNNGTYNNSTYE